ncbi:hypothetical protein L210DRAFT_3518399, partial [Boletus edulis BED1]
CYVFDPRSRFPFQMVAKRYRIGECQDATLLRMTRMPSRSYSCMGMGHWEVTIQRLYQQASPRRSVLFHGMWSIDMPNH